MDSNDSNQIGERELTINYGICQESKERKASKSVFGKRYEIMDPAGCQQP
jgi:hypothetical protein